MLKIYFDTCVWCRPFDEPDEFIIREVEAIEMILDLHDHGEIKIVSSDLVISEASLISNERKRRAVIELIKSLSDDIVKVDDVSINLAEKIKEDCNLTAVDALHVALASKFADVFITVDKGILRKVTCLQKYIMVLSPINFNEHYGRSIR